MAVLHTDIKGNVKQVDNCIVGMQCLQWESNSHSYDNSI